MAMEIFTPDAKTPSVTTVPFVIMLKPVGSQCNLRCEYCYYLETSQYFPETGHPVMTNELLDDAVRQYIEANPGSVVQFTWHGGEPTLAGLDFYRKVVEFQKKYLPDGRECWNNLQTNGILLDNEWCAFLAENHFDVGLSLDGTQWLHDAYRKDRGGNGTYERVAASAARLMAHGIRPDLLCTVTSRSAREPRTVYNELKRLNTGWIQFIPIVRRLPDGTVSEDSVTPEGYGRFLCEIFDEWSLNDIGHTDVQLFAETARVWSGGSATLCWMASTCGRAVIVERDGGIYSCDHFVSPDYFLGNINETPLAELVDDERQIRFGDDKRDLLPESCRACPWLGVCAGGCPKDRFSVSKDGKSGLNYLCDGLKTFFAYAREPLTEISRLRNLGTAPAAIMAKLRDRARIKWKGVGRNDPCPCGSGRKAKNCCWDKRP